MEEEDLKWKQRAKHKWLNECDRNTKFFHVCANQRRKTNLIKSIYNGEGNNANTPEEINDMFQNFFKDLFSTSQPTEIEACLQSFEAFVIADMNLRLLQDISDKEITKAIFQMNGLGSLGPNGFPSIFYEKHWQIVGK